MRILGAIAAIGVLLAAAGAAGQGLYKEPGRPELFPKNFGYKDARPELFPPNYGYRYQKPAPAEKWRNPYAGRRRSEYREPSEYRESREYEGSGGLGMRRRGKSDITGFRREPLGGDNWAPR